MPSAFSCRTRSRTCAVSAGPSAAVGSSMIRILAWKCTARAIHFNARILIMDEPTAALGPAETAQVGELIKQLKAEGIGIFLISHDMNEVFEACDRVTVMKNGAVVDTVNVAEVTQDDVLGMIILGERRRAPKR